MGFRSQLKHAWNAFTNQDRAVEVETGFGSFGSSSSSQPHRPFFRMAHERSIIASIYTRIAIDVASIDIRHVRVDEEDRYQEDIKSGLHNCLTLSANLDQSARVLKQDAVLTMFDHGVVGVVPVDTNVEIGKGSVDILTMRAGPVTAWYPQHVKVDLYDERDGRHKQPVLEKKNVALVENPLYMVMNEPNSTLQRLMRKLALLDAVDEQSSSGKLDVIIQLPYVVKTESMQRKAERRKEEIEFQLKGSKYGIAYIDGTEKVTQLNRPAENNLLKQVEYLMNMLYAQLGITEEVMNGTAEEAAMLNYINRTVKPIVESFVEEYKRKFLTQTARTQGQSIKYFRDPFELVPMSDMAEMSDKFARNEIFSSNELRQFMGVRPSRDPKADELRNSNMPQPNGPVPADTVVVEEDDDPYAGLNEKLDQIFDDLDVSEDGDEPDSG